jgi:hypothetical protein
MKLLTSIIAIIGIIITIVFTIFPIGYLTIFPAIITVLCGVILYKIYKGENGNTLFPKLIIGLALVGALISISRSLFTSDTIADDQKFEQRQEKSSQEAVNDLEDLD